MSDGRPALAHPDAIVAGDTYRFTVLSPRLIRMEWHERGEFVDQRTQLVVSRDFDLPEFTVVQLPDGALEILTEYLQVRYDGKEFSEAGLTVTLLKGATDPHYSSWRYGFRYPQQPPFRGNLLGTARTLDEVDGATELEFGILATYGFAALDDSTSALLSEDGWIAPRPDAGPRGRKDIYLFAHGRDFHAALADFHRLTGPNPLVPRYTLGNWWSRYWPYSEDEYLALMDRFEKERIPLSVSVIDMDWHLVNIDPEIGTGWTGYTWNSELFPDPKRFLDELHQRGLAVTLNVHPADGVRRHEEAYPQMAEAVGIDPASGLPVAFDVTSREFVDAYLRYLHHPLEEQGVDFWWLDWQSGGATNVPGLDPLWMLNHIHFHDSGRDGKRPLTFSRYAGVGSHRYPVGFSGDTIITWDSLDFQPYFTNTAANVGYTWWSHDIGGHMFGARDVELTVRWFQYGVFSPINRLHSSNSNFTTKEPWAFGAQAFDIMARFMRLRHRLIPSLYTAAWRAHTDAVAVVRPMYHDAPTVGEAYRVPNQSMFGEHLLVAPITAPEHDEAKLGVVNAWLPEGGWFDIFTGQHYRGGSQLALHRGLEQLPVLARAGAVLPLADAMEPVTDAPAALMLRVFPGDGISHLIEDHGEGVPSAEDRNVTRFVQNLWRWDDGRAELRLVIEPTTGPDPRRERDLVIEVVGAVAVDGFDGAQVVSDETLSPALRIDLGRVDLSAGVDLRLRGLVAAEADVVKEAFDLLDAAEIAFVTKEKAWAAVRRLDGLALAQELATIDLPEVLRGAILERASATKPW
ncbi:glycoside hydrolase family 31 protein [Tessaracoccus caeni]|uniref:glycoside hydrolase family 31 protein n=1 Tax=Tessaracoccus caeni TaxID=3031239 RepID=UPI0023DC75F8|nr:TIM-barrel domain-containing protein [Tessaracoccus caeni]MDF1490004.1 glycoside hydrolase family 31 protein [Tessaracoccus caeni]